MAKIYRRVNGQKVTKIIALEQEVQNRLTVLTYEAALQAEARLAAHFHTGASRIDIEEGDVDHYVVLDDTRGLDAALSIEYGRKELAPGQNSKYPNGAPATAGLFVLHRAFGLNEGGLNNLPDGGDTLD